MATAAFDSVADFFRQQIISLKGNKTIFENKAPGLTAFNKDVEHYEITEKGYKIPFINRRPGGHTAYLPSSSSFNAAVSPSSQAMYVYPTRYALPVVLAGALLRALRAGSADKAIQVGDYIREYFDAALKRLEHVFYGDGSGALAFSSSTLAATGSGQTMNCTTTAAATPGQTKGARRLEAGHTYQAINTTTGAVRGTILVETEGTSSCVVNVLSGSVTSGDPLVDVGAYNRYMRGLGHLISKATRVLQGLSTGSFAELNSPEVDLNGTLCTPADFDQAKTMLQTRNNDETAENKLLCFLTYGFYSTLKRQGWNLTIQDKEATHGVAKRFVDGDTMFIRTSDMDDDRSYFAHPDQVKMFGDAEPKDLDLDGQEWRMVMGTNSTGSDDWQRAIAFEGNPGIVLSRSCAYIKRALITGQVTQVNSY